MYTVYSSFFPARFIYLFIYLFSFGKVIQLTAVVNVYINHKQVGTLFSSSWTRLLSESMVSVSLVGGIFRWEESGCKKIIFPSGSW